MTRQEPESEPKTGYSRQIQEDLRLFVRDTMDHNEDSKNIPYETRRFFTTCFHPLRDERRECRFCGENVGRKLRTCMTHLFKRCNKPESFINEFRNHLGVTCPLAEIMQAVAAKAAMKIAGVPYGEEEFRAAQERIQDEFSNLDEENAR